MSTPATTSQSEPFAERVGRLLRELDRGIKWNRPSILLAIYSSEFVRADAEAELSARLRERGQTISTYRVAGEEQADIPLHLSQHLDREHTVFFVSGLRWGGGPDGLNTYRALNIRREYFVDYRIRAVFWLTESEAIGLPRYAPDFWAFRHRVVEFVEAPQGEQIDRNAWDLIWHDLRDRSLYENINAKIVLREALLSDLPDSDETLSTRGELLYTLAELYRAKQDYDRSMILFQNALKVVDQLDVKRLQTWCSSGLGNVYRGLGRSEEAITTYQCAIELDPKFAHPYKRLGDVYRDLGRTEEAIAAYQRAVELDPKFAIPHYGLGALYRDLGRTEEAIAAYRQAIALEPWRQRVLAQVLLAGCYRRLHRDQDYEEQVRQIIPLLNRANEYERALFMVIVGDVDEALALLEVALQKNQVAPAWVRRDPDFAALGDDPRFQALVGTQT